MRVPGRGVCRANAEETLLNDAQACAQQTPASPRRQGGAFIDINRSQVRRPEFWRGRVSAQPWTRLLLTAPPARTPTSYCTGRHGVPPRKDKFHARLLRPRRGRQSDQGQTSLCHWFRQPGPCPCDEFEGFRRQEHRRGAALRLGKRQEGGSRRLYGQKRRRGGGLGRHDDDGGAR